MRWPICRPGSTEWSTLAQLRALGLGAGAIKYRRQAGVCTSFIAGFSRRPSPPSPPATAMAAVLACGPDAALSHGSAAALWRIIPRWPSPTHVTTPTEHRRNGIHVHRSPNADATTHYGIPVTTSVRRWFDPCR